MARREGARSSRTSCAGRLSVCMLAVDASGSGSWRLRRCSGREARGLEEAYLHASHRLRRRRGMARTGGRARDANWPPAARGVLMLRLAPAMSEFVACGRGAKQGQRFAVKCCCCWTVMPTIRPAHDGRTDVDVRLAEQAEARSRLRRTVTLARRATGARAPAPRGGGRRRVRCEADDVEPREDCRARIVR